MDYENLKRKIFWQMIGIVEDNFDPLEEGRLKVRIFGLTDKKDENDDYIIPTSCLPWARSGCINSSGAFSVPKIGSYVYINAGDIYNPIWTGMVYLNNDAKMEIGDDKNAHTLVYDTDFSNGEENNYREGEHIKIYFSENKGVVIDYKTCSGGSYFNMTPNGDIKMMDGNGDSIILSNGTITIKSDNKIKIDAPCIELGQDAVEGVLKSESFRKLFEKHTHMYESGQTTPPIEGMNPNVINKKILV